MVTGAASGIGYALAELPAARGIHVMIAEIRADAVHDAVQSLTGRRGQIEEKRSDVADQEDL